MTHHILNGDSLAHIFPAANIGGQVIVFREALIGGDLSGATPAEFWKTRGKYMRLGSDQYQLLIIDELEKVKTAGKDDDFNLWFEYDLFCQVNMWFIMSMLHLLPKKKVFAVYSTHLPTDHKHFWNGFGSATAQDLRSCFSDRFPLTDKDIALGHALWQAYLQKDTEKLVELSKIDNPAFPLMQPVLEALLDTHRPARTIEDILDTNGPANFEYVFTEFWKREPVYGFGDIQLRAIYDSVLEHRKKKN